MSTNKTNIKWNDQKIQDFHQHMSKHIGNLAEGFRTYATLNGHTYKACEKAYYDYPKVRAYFDAHPILMLVNTVMGVKTNVKNSLNQSEDYFFNYTIDKFLRNMY